MARYRSGNKPLSEPMLICLTDTYGITRPQWVNNGRSYWDLNLMCWNVLKIHKNIFVLLSSLLKIKMTQVDDILSHGRQESGPCFNIKTVFPGMGILMLKIRWSGNHVILNSLWPNDAIWRHGSASTLAQVMACCLMAPSHYLNQCWLIISKIQFMVSTDFQKKNSSTFQGLYKDIFAIFKDIFSVVPGVLQ